MSKRLEGVIPPATPRQLEVMRAIRRIEQETADGIGMTALSKVLGGNVKHLLFALRDKGWADLEDRKWGLTDAGIDVLEGSPELVAPAKAKPRAPRKPASLPPPETTALPPTHWKVIAAREIDAVALEHGVTRSEMLSRSIVVRLVVARRAAMSRLRELGLSFLEIGAVFGRDYSSVRTACQRHAESQKSKAAE